MVKLFGENDYRRLEDGETYVNKFVIVKPDFFKPEFRSAEFQLFYAVGGFGCDPNKMGNAVFGADHTEMDVSSGEIQFTWSSNRRGYSGVGKRIRNEPSGSYR